MAAFTYLWKREQFEIARETGDDTLPCAGGNTFRNRGVHKGDDLYIVSFFEGRLYLLGRIAVVAVCGPKEARRLTGRDDINYSWAREWAVADPSRSTSRYYDLVVPPKTVRGILFDGRRPPFYRGDGDDAEPDPQTFRGVRALSLETAKAFDRLLADRERAVGGEGYGTMLKNDPVRIWNDVLQFMVPGTVYTTREVVVGVGRTPGAAEGDPVVNVLRSLVDGGLVEQVGEKGKANNPRQYSGYCWRRIANAPPPRASDLDAPPAERVSTTTLRIVRDTELAQWVKQQHGHLCQICGETVRLANGSGYAEGHHLRPLGKPHNGPDVATNIVCLCPNHHAAVDLGAIRLELRWLRRVDSHPVGKHFIAYHNEKIFRG